MFLKKLSHLKNSLLFRLTILYALTFTVLSGIGFLVFYYRIYSVTMEHLDVELLDESQKYTDLIKENNVEAAISKISQEAELEDPAEDFYRLFDFKGDILFTTDMSAWGTIGKQDILRKLQNEGSTSIIQTLSIEERDDKARMITAIVGPDTVLQIGESLEEVDEYLDIFLQLFSILIISLIVVSSIIGWLLA
ncbi:MAG: hypothetical protein PVI49_07465, partial [Desulfobacterales bacterium]